MKPHIVPCICDTCLEARGKEIERVLAHQRQRIVAEVEYWEKHATDPDTTVKYVLRRIKETFKGTLTSS